MPRTGRPCRDVQLSTADGETTLLDFPDATHIHESHGFCRMGRRAGRNRVVRTLHVFGTGPAGRFGHSRSTRIDVVLEASCADNVAEHSERTEVSSFVGCSRSQRADANEHRSDRKSSR